MKNMLLLLTTSFLLLSSISVSGQSNIFQQKIATHNQIDLFSSELISLVNIAMRDTSIFNIKNMLYIDNVSINANSSTDDAFEIGLTNEMIPSTSLNRSLNNTKALNALFLLKTNSSSILMTPLNYGNKWNLKTQQALFNGNSHQSIINESCVSIMCLGSTVGWIELDHEEWNQNKEIMIQSKVSSLGNWQFNLGPDENSNYVIPILR